jgi:hypothetical protein
VALSVGIAIVLGVLRILRGWSLPMIVVGGYILVMVMTLFAPKEIVGLAYDLGGVTTSTVTVPLVTALGVGLARTIRGRNPLTDGFGLIALASLTPMIFVMVFGLFCPLRRPMELFLDPTKLLLATAKDVLPVLGLLVLFQMVVLRRPLPRPGRIIFGFCLVLVGMACFLGGLDLALFPVGQAMALQLSAKRPKPGRRSGPLTGGYTCLPFWSGFPPPSPSRR